MRNLVEVDQGAHEYFVMGAGLPSLGLIERNRVHEIGSPFGGFSRFAYHFGLWQEWAVRRYRLDIVHEGVPTSPFWRFPSRPVVLTVHDLTPLLFPDAFPLRFRLAFRIALKSGLRRAAHIICVSDRTRTDLVNFFPDCAGKSTVNRLAPQPFPSNGHDPCALTRYGIEKPYLLSVATLEPRKNHQALFGALRILNERGHRYQLVCVGELAWKTGTILNHPVLQENRTQVVFTGVVEPGVLRQLYCSAECLIYPSFYEGFGLPPLEALSLGVPALVSRNSSMPEILGDAPYWLSAQPGAEEIASAVEQLASEPDLRQQRVRAGLLQAQLYDWKKTARETLSIYDRVTGR